MQSPENFQPSPPGIKASPKPKSEPTKLRSKTKLQSESADPNLGNKPKPDTTKSKPSATGKPANAKPSATIKSAPVPLDVIHQKVIQSIEAAGKAMSTARPEIENAKGSKKDRNNVVSKGSEVIGALLAPGRQVADLLGALGPLFPPCKQASNILAALIKFESNRNEKDVRVSVVYFDLARALAHVGALNRESRPTKLVADTLGESLKNFKGLMEEFGQFCEAYYQTKGPESRLKHLLHWKSHKDNLSRFTDRIELLKRDLIGLLSRQAVPHPGQHTDTLAQIESRLLQNRAFYGSIRDANEEIAEAFVYNHGGQAAVQTNGKLLKQLAINVGESVTQSIVSAIKGTADMTLKQSQSAFASKLKGTLDKWVSGSQEEKVQAGSNHNTKVVRKTQNTGRKPHKASTHSSHDVGVYEYVVEESVTVDADYQESYQDDEEVIPELGEGDGDDQEPYLQEDEDADPKCADDDDDQTPCLENVEDAGEYPGGDMVQNPYYAQDDGEGYDSDGGQRDDDGDQEPEFYPQSDDNDSGTYNYPQSDDDSGDEGDDW